jgi:hypothetical protein
MIGSLSPLPAPLRGEVNSSFSVKEIKDYYLPNSKNVIFRYVVYFCKYIYSNEKKLNYLYVLYKWIFPPVEKLAYRYLNFQTFRVRKYYAKVEFNDRLLDIHATGSSSDFINS